MNKFQTRLLFMAGLLLSCGWILPVNAACNSADTALKALKESDLKAGEAAIAASLSNRDCSAEEQQQTFRYVSLIKFNQISASIQGGASLEQFEDTLGDWEKAGASWQIFDALGDIARKKKDFAKAADYYLIALEEASDATHTPDWMAPDEAYIRHLDKSATEMRLASNAPPRLSIRSGCKISYRSVTIRKKTTPIRFKFGKDEFADHSEAAAMDLFKCLQSVGAKGVTLVGHTDPVGSDDVNQELSERRAERLASFLVDQGFKGEIATLGKGESEPFKVDDPTAYDTETLHQMHRRVDANIIR